MSALPPITADPPAAPAVAPDCAPAAAARDSAPAARASSPAAALDGTSIPTPANPAPPSAPACNVPNSTPPTSPPSTEAILRALHAAAFNLVETADSLNIPLSRLVALLDQPETDAAVTSLQNASRKCLELRAVQARTAAITILEKLARETEDPVEQRRSAIALVRATILRNLSVAPAVPPREPRNPTGIGWESVRNLQRLLNGRGDLKARRRNLKPISSSSHTSEFSKGRTRLLQRLGVVLALERLRVGRANRERPRYLRNAPPLADGGVLG